jgi:hypothetical protein
MLLKPPSDGYGPPSDLANRADKREDLLVDPGFERRAQAVRRALDDLQDGALDKLGRVSPVIASA